MAKKALLSFSPMEYRYQDTYGIMPDYDYIRFVSSGMSFDDAGEIISARMHEIWKKMKYEYEHKEEIEQARIMSQLEKECPF